MQKIYDGRWHMVSAYFCQSYSIGCLWGQSRIDPRSKQARHPPAKGKQEPASKEISQSL